MYVVTRKEELEVNLRPFALLASGNHEPVKRLVILLAITLAACGVPRDPEATLARVSGGVMRVGVTDAPPWVELGDTAPDGIEVRLVEQFAEELDAEIEWVEGSEQELFGALKFKELDLVLGGLTTETPWSAEAGITHPYLTTAALVAVPEDSQVSEDIAGLEVGVEANTEIAGQLRKTDARVVEVDAIEDYDGPVAIENYLTDDLEVVDTGVRLSESDHVFALPMGENDWMTKIEAFLLERPDEIKQLLDELGTP
jgi:polar amino acid transport system substrate-binding protein